MYASHVEPLGLEDVSDPSHHPLIEDSFPYRALALTRHTPCGFLPVEVRGHDVRPDNAHDGMDGKRLSRQQFHDGTVEEHGLVAFSDEAQPDSSLRLAIGHSGVPDLPGAIHHRMGANGVAAGEMEEKVLPTRLDGANKLTNQCIGSVAP